MTFKPLLFQFFAYVVFLNECVKSNDHTVSLGPARIPVWEKLHTVEETSAAEKLIQSYHCNKGIPRLDIVVANEV